MSLNKYMHPRNRYKLEKPSFLKLALKYPAFRAHTTQDEAGKVYIDFKDADALRALTTCLLKEDFDLSVQLPSDRLVPTLPLRLNYIHWLEDIVGTQSGKWGIDVGTGASCVYPLLAAKMNGWKFLATEADPENIFHAKKNVSANELDGLIHVVPATEEDALKGPLEGFHQTDKFDFCMCNPPFFADHMEAQAITNTRSVNRPDADSMSTASPQECIIQGGEVAFVRQMIEESAVLRDKIRVYSSMVGKKSSLAKLREELKHQKVPKFSTTEFCQGKTMRWGVAWSYDETVEFPKSRFESRKEKPPLHWVVPTGAAGVEYQVHRLASYIKNLMEEIKVHCYQGKMAKSYTSITLTAAANTWCHQRRLRRQRQQQKGEARASVEASSAVFNVGVDMKEPPKAGTASVNEDSPNANKRPLESPVMSSNGEEVKKRKLSPGVAGTHVHTVDPGTQVHTVDPGTHVHTVDPGTQVHTVDPGTHVHTVDPGTHVHTVDPHNKSIEENHEPVTKSGGMPQEEQAEKKAREGPEHEQTSTDMISLPEAKATEASESRSAETGSHTEVDEKKAGVDTSPREFILKCVLRLKRADEQIVMELEWLAGQSRELMHQVMTFIQNKLKLASS